MKAVVVGTGYVGLVQGACLAHLGHNVVCVDIDTEKIANLREGDIPFYEKDLPELVKAGVASGRLKFTTNLQEAVEGEKPAAVFVCVQTPRRDDGQCDLTYIETVLRSIGTTLSGTSLIVIKSSVPPGTKKDLYEWLGNQNLELAVNPEFLREGTSVRDFLEPDRIIFGVESAWASDVLTELHKDIDAPVLVMSVESAQLAKYASNNLLALRLSFINEIANIADALGADVTHVSKAIGHDPRFGKAFLRAGAGFGGSCFPKDVLALHNVALSSGYHSKLIAPIMAVNDEQPYRFVKKIEDRFGGVSGKRFGVWGLAFNKGTDDARESPAVKVAKILSARGALLSVFDPKATENARKELGMTVSYANTMHEVLDEAEALLVLTEWPEFADADWSHVKANLKQPVVFDGKNFLPHDEIRAQGFEVHGMGLQDLWKPKEERPL